VVLALVAMAEVRARLSFHWAKPALSMAATLRLNTGLRTIKGSGCEYWQPI